LRARPITRILALAIAVTGSLAIPSAALAAYTPAVDVSVVCAPSAVVVGQLVDCVVSVSAAGTTVTITVDSTPTTPDTRTAVADASGQILFSYTATTAGVDRVSISGDRSGEAFSAFTLTNVLDTSVSVLGVAFDAPDGDANGATDDEAKVLGIVLDAESANAEIANTGSEAGVLAAIAIGSIAIGGGTLVASRRRRSVAA
jgi:LPXTG-motif cell wall-anchored protein